MALDGGIRTRNIGNLTAAGSAATGTSGIYYQLIYFLPTLIHKQVFPEILSDFKPPQLSLFQALPISHFHYFFVLLIVFSDD